MKYNKGIAGLTLALSLLGTAQAKDSAPRILSSSAVQNANVISVTFAMETTVSGRTLPELRGKLPADVYAWAEKALEGRATLRVAVTLSEDKWHLSYECQDVYGEAMFVLAKI